MGVARHHPKIERYGQRHAATYTESFYGADRDLLHVIPGLGQPRSKLQMPSQRTDIHGAAGPALGIPEVKSGAERTGPAGQHDDRGFAVVLKATGGRGELTERFGR